jgi:hypothetical protein
VTPCASTAIQQKSAADSNQRLMPLAKNSEESRLLHRIAIRPIVAQSDFNIHGRGGVGADPDPGAIIHSK